MRNLLYKEFRLVINPLYFLITLSGALLLIPQWLYFIAMMYFFFFVVPNIFTFAKSQNDIGFTVMLSVRKRDVVGARVLSVTILELTQIVSAVVFSVFSRALYPGGNFMIDANNAYLGGVLAMYGLFNVVFFSMHYKSAYKVGLPLLAAVMVSVLFAAVIEALVLAVPAAAYVLDGISGEALVRQLPVLAAGIVIYVLLTWLAYKLSVKRFEKVDL